MLVLLRRRIAMNELMSEFKGISRHGARRTPAQISVSTSVRLKCHPAIDRRERRK